MPILIDSHLDLSWNALSWDRDLTRTLDEINIQERGMTDNTARGHATISFGELQKANVALCLGTLLVRTLPWGQRKHIGGAVAVSGSGEGGAMRTDLDFNSQSITYSIAHGQLAWYHLMEAQGYIKLIRTKSDLDQHWEKWTSKANNQDNPAPLGVILAMEGGDPILDPDNLEQWWNLGLRSLEPVHYGKSVYAVGTGFDGPLTEKGRQLIKQMDRLGVILDVTHLSDTSMDEALDLFQGQAIASHHNCRALVPRDRQLTDEQIKRLIQRGGVIGAAIDNWMLDPDWQIGKSSPQTVGLENVADHIEHVCHLAGNTNHAAIGTDLDGGFGTEQTPRDLQTYSDLQKLAPILSKRGLSDSAIDDIFFGNWLRVFRQTLPD